LGRRGRDGIGAWNRDNKDDMSISYSGLVNYGKATLPAIEAWSTNNNVVRDPPRSIMTRRIERVGDTSDILATVADSADRYCENINYYARDVNPFVSVSYGEAGSHGTAGAFGSDSRRLAGGEPFMPYRIIRDGAFRPPIWRQEDVLPLSRLPRNWTTCEARPFLVNYSQRALNCGTAAETREVHEELRKASCETARTISAYPQLTAPPLTTYMVKDPLAPGTAETNKSWYAYGVEASDHALPTLRDGLHLGGVDAGRCWDAFDDGGHRERPSPRTRDALVGSMPTNPSAHAYQREPTGWREAPALRETRPNAWLMTNIGHRVEHPTVPRNIRLDVNRPNTAACTNRGGGAIFDYEQSPRDATFTRLAPRDVSAYAFDARPSIPALASDAPRIALRAR
jgi:hypothetical protein